MRIDSRFFSDNRRELLSRIPEGTAVFLFAGLLRPQSADNDYRFLVDRDFYYMTGIECPEAKLILIHEKDHGEKQLLFIPPKDPMVERWHGKRADKEEVSAISGIAVEDIFDLGDFDERAYPYLHGEYVVATDSNSIGEDTATFMALVEGDSDIGSVLVSMRLKKKPEEISAIREAARITEEALSELRKKITEGMSEMEIYAELEYQMSKRGSLIPAFTTITAIDGNAFYLHHADPEGKDGAVIGKGSQIQIDVGARAAGYCADISRLMIYGREEDGDPRRVRLIELIRKLRKRAFEFIAPDVTFASLNEEMRRIAGEWLVKEGLIEAVPADGASPAAEDTAEAQPAAAHAPEAPAPAAEDIGRYYWHNTSHYMGLNVHDVGGKELPFEEGNCLAVEPGVYIPEWGFGFRIEDDVLVTKDGCELLSSGDDSGEGIYLL